MLDQREAALEDLPIAFIGQQPPDELAGFEVAPFTSSSAARSKASMASGVSKPLSGSASAGGASGGRFDGDGYSLQHRWLQPAELAIAVGKTVATD